MRAGQLRGSGHSAFPVSQIECLLADLAMVYTHFGFTKVTLATVAANGGWFDYRGAIFNSALNILATRQ